MIKNLKVLKKKARGFTLIELLVVISIIAILSGVIILNSADARAKARNAKRKSDLNTIASALESYYADFNAYPNGEGIFNLNTLGDPATGKCNIPGDLDAPDSSRLIKWPNFASSLNGKWNGNTRRIWLWDLVLRGYINNTPKDPLNLPSTSVKIGGASIDFVVGGFNYAVGFHYMYLNDLPWYEGSGDCPSIGNADEYFGDTGGSYYAAQGLCGPIVDNLGTPHAQVYKLVAATERAGADKGFANDGGNFNFRVEIESVRDKGKTLRIGTDAGAYYEVSSAGARQFPPRSTPDAPDPWKFCRNDFVFFSTDTACSF